MLSKGALIDLNNIQENMVLHATTSSRENDTTTWCQLTTYGVLCVIPNATCTSNDDDTTSV